MSIPLKHLVGSTLILGFRGSSVTEESSIVKQIKEYRLAGVILFDKDMVNQEPVHNIKSPEQVKTLCSQLQSASEETLFISIDQEGGLVNRLKPEYGFPSTRSHQTLGELDSIEETHREALLIGKTCREIGINLNFAPCVDVDTNPENPIIHKKQRSFSARPLKVAEHAKVFVDGLNKFGVLAALKHFPGHGSSFGDTHLGFTDVSDTWLDIELKPYEILLGQGFDQLIMSSHIYNKHLDAEHPATLSKSVITGLLRQKLGFKGLIVSDDLQMGAITSNYGLDKAIILALNAGINLLCFGNNLVKDPVTAEQVYLIVDAALKTGELNIKMLEENYNRIKTFKKQKLTFNSIEKEAI